MIFLRRPDSGRTSWVPGLRTVTVGAVLLIMVVPVPAAGQHIALDSIVRCATCRIEVGAPIVLQGEHEQGSITNLVHFLRVAHDGSIYFADRDFSDPSIQVHRPDGSLSALKIGRGGGGPGEFRFPSDLHINGDTLFVADQRQQRITAFHRTTGRVLYTLSNVPVRQGFLPLDDGRVVIGGAVSTRQTAGQPLHVYSGQRPGLTWERSFGLDEPILMPGDEPILSRRLARDAGTTFWAARSNAYHLELWDAATGRVLRSLKGERAWFRPWESASEVVELRRETPRPTILSSMARGPDGLLWVVFSRARPKTVREWRAAFDTETGMVDGMGAPVRDTRLLFETVVEVIDPAAGVVLARHVFQDLKSTLAGPSVLYGSWIDEQGLPRAEVVPLRLVRR